MAKNYVHPGNTVTYTNANVTGAVAIKSGDGVQQGSLFGVAQTDIPIGASGELDVRGVWDMAKTSAQAWAVGQKIYWDAVNRVATTTVGSNKLIGVAVEVPAANPSPIGRVHLQPTP